MTKEDMQAIAETKYPDYIFHDVAITQRECFVAGLEYYQSLLTPSADVQERAKKYADKVMPFVWPKNKRGEDIQMLVGQKNPPFSAKHRKEQQRIINAYLAGHAGASGAENRAYPPATKTWEIIDRIKEVVNGETPDGDLYSIITQIVFDVKDYERNATSGMKWVKASERKPDLKAYSESELFFKFDGKKAEVSFSEDEFEVKTYKGYTAYDNEHLHRVEWLDESGASGELESLKAENERLRKLLIDQSYSIWKGCESSMSFDEWQEKFIEGNQLTKQQ